MKIFLRITIFFLLVLSCEKENTGPNPEDIIQGKWTIIQMGDGDNLFPYTLPWYIEYYDDSLLREFDSTSMQFNFVGQYSIDKLLTHFYQYDSDTLIDSYIYQFFDNNNKLKLVDYNIISTFNTRIYKRIY